MKVETCGFPWVHIYQQLGHILWGFSFRWCIPESAKVKGSEILSTEPLTCRETVTGWFMDPTGGCCLNPKGNFSNCWFQITSGKKSESLIEEVFQLLTLSLPFFQGLPNRGVPSDPCQAMRKTLIV